jgi:hypothetical protein
MLIKIHKSYRNTLAICDSDLLEKTLEEGNKQLKITKNFFGGQEKTDEEVLEEIEKAAAEDYTFNIVGKKAVSLALKTGLIRQEGVQYIQGIPVALVLL